MAHNGGRALVDVDLPNSAYQAPFLNALKSCNGWFTIQGSGATTDYLTLFDNRGYPTQMAGGSTTWFLPQIWVWGAAGDTWVLDWPGTAAMTLTINLTSGGYTTNVVSSNRIEYTLTGTPQYSTFGDGTPIPALLSSISITSMSTNTFAGGDIRLYLKNGSPSGPDYETRLNNGEIFTPKFTSVVGKFGVIRFMTWCVTNQNVAGYVGKWADRPPVDSITYWNNQLPTIRSQYYAGASLGGSAIVVGQPPSTISSWTQGQKIQFALTNPLDWVFPAGFTNGNPTIFHSIAHGLSNGDQIQTSPGDFSWRYIASPSNENEFRFWTVTVIDADHFSVPFDSTSAGVAPNIQQTSLTGVIGPSSAVLTASSVSGTLAVGQVILGAGVAADTQIVSLGTGTGGAGTYNLSGGSQTIVSEAMTSVQMLPYTKVVTLKVGSLAAVPCCATTYCANFSPNFQWAFGALPLSAGDYIDGTYDAVLNAVMLGNYNYSNNSIEPFGLGVPIEVLVRFCKDNGNHLYICILSVTDDDYITQLATYLKANFTDVCPGQLVMIEPDNEVWNGGLRAWYSARANVEINNAYFHLYYGKRIAHINSLFQAVFGAGGSYRVMFGMSNQYVFGTPGNNPFVADRAMDFPYFGQTCTISIANPAVVTTGSPHGFSIDDLVVLHSTNFNNGLPSPFKDATDGGNAILPTYYVLSSGFGSTTVQLATSPGGTPISTLGGSQSGVQSIAHPPIMNSHAIVHAPYIDSAILAGTSANYPSTSPPVGGFADQVYNYTQGGAGQIASFDYYKNSLLNASLDQTDFPSGFYVNLHFTVTLPFWSAVATALNSIAVQQYEGGQNVFGSSNQAGFPVTAPTSGQMVTKANVASFMLDFYASQQFADVVTTMFNGCYNLGNRFPAYFTVEGPQQVGAYWPIQRLNTDYNGFTDAPLTLAYLALRAFNDPVTAPTTGTNPPRINLVRM